MSTADGILAQFDSGKPVQKGHGDGTNVLSFGRGRDAMKRDDGDTKQEKIKHDGYELYQAQHSLS